MKKPPTEPTLLTEDDLYLFNEGTHTRLQDKMGAHLMTVDGTPGRCSPCGLPTPNPST